MKIQAFLIFIVKRVSCTRINILVYYKREGKLVIVALIGEENL